MMNNNRTINMLEISRWILKRIRMHPTRSIQQAALIERLDPDAVARALKSFSQYLGGGKLTECRGGGLIALTKLGSDGLELLEQFLLLAENQAQQVDKVRFAVSPGIPSDILSLALSRFLFNHGREVSPEITVVNEGMRDLVRSREFAFALDLCVAGSAVPDEKLAGSITGSIAIPLDHRLVGAGMIDADHFSEGDRVFLSPYIAPACTDLLARVPTANRIVIADANLRHRLTAINAGLALDFASPSLLPGDAFVRLPVSEVQPATIGLWLPRRQDQLSESAKALISEIRYANLPPITPLDHTCQDEGLPEIPPLPEPMSA
jgi:hypothetical protein